MIDFLLLIDQSKCLLMVKVECSVVVRMFSD